MASYLKASIQRSYAESFLAELERNENQYFFFIGKGTPWTVETSPALYVDTVRAEYQAMDDIIGYKKLNPQNIIFALPRYEWQSGTVYDQYSDTTAQFDDTDPAIFYVVTDDNNIYKCLNNNNAAASTYKPSQVLTTPFNTDDGYTWQYLATVKEGDLPYELTDYIPVDFATVSTDTETQNQYNTQISAVNSSITRIDVTNASGASAGVYQNTITVDGGAVVLNVAGYDRATNRVTITDSQSRAKITASGIDTANYIGYIMRVNYSQLNPAQVGNYAIITGISVTNNDVVFQLQDDSVSFSVTPSGNSQLASVEILPYVKIVGSGSGAYAIPVMNSNKSISGITVVNRGRNYAAAIAEVTSYKTPTTAHPTLSVVLSPKGGHGSNILKELNVKDILIIVKITEDDAAKIVGGGSYRQFGIIKNPVLADGTGNFAGRDDLYYRDITVIADDGFPVLTDFGVVADQGKIIGTDSSMILGTESYAAAKIVEVKSSSSDKVTVKTLNSTGRFITKQDRQDDYILSLTTPSANYQVDETVIQTIPAGTDFGSGVSYGFDLTVSGKVLSYTGTTLGVRLLTDGNFVALSGVTIAGSVSGATAFVSGVSPSYGEYLRITKTVGGVVSVVSNIEGSQQPYKVVEAGSAYFDLNNTPAYSGLHVLELSSSISSQTGALDATTAPLLQTSFASGDTIYQGVTGSYGHYATGQVYYWDYVNSSYGKLYVTNVVGKFKSVAANGITGSTLGAYIVASVTEPEIDQTSGEILYIDNVRPIQRTVGQQEEFRLRLGF